jgi:C4-dicarboxylate-binding protein DctP
MTALGANPQQVPYGETYMALKTNVVDGQENPCSNIAEMKFYEVQKYFTEVNYQIHPDPFFVSLTWYDTLSSDLKALFNSVAKAAMAKSDEVWLASEKDYQALLTQKLQANKITTENHKAFVARVKPVWDYYVSAGYFTRAEIDEALAQAAR